MKFSSLIILVLFCFQQRLWSQDGMTFRPLVSDHETVSSVKVSYRAVSQASVNEDNADMRMIAVPQATVSLKDSADVSRIYFSIICLKSDSVIYQSDYDANASALTNDDGYKLFENSNSNIFLSNGSTLALKPYVYMIETEDSQGIKSTAFKIIQ